MKRITLAILALWLSGVSWALPTLGDEDIAVLHWLPQTSGEALLRTRALTLWLNEADAEVSDWRRQVDLRTMALARQSERWLPLGVVPVDGMLGWLVQARDQNLSAPGTATLLIDSLLSGLSVPLAGSPVSAQTRMRAEPAWSELRVRLRDAGGPEGGPEINAFWAGLGVLSEQIDGADRAHALEQVRRTHALSELQGSERLQALVRIARAESAVRWRRGDDLGALWSLLEALMLLTPLAETDEAAALLALIVAMTEQGEGRLRAVDESFPVLLAQLQDAAEYLGEQPPATNAAIHELTDAYFRLTLFVPEAAYYLDQPVREHIGQAIAECYPDPDLVGPLPRQIFEQCPERLFGLLRDGLGNEELVGGGGGPFAPEFLRREMSLVSWQRARYLDGHLNWQLQAGCETPQWINPLEWSILVQYLATWVPQRPVFFGSARWQEAMDDLGEHIETQFEAQAAWLDCISGLGGQRQDPVRRLILRQARALADLASSLESADRTFLAEQTRAGSDVDLERPADQITAYRPEGLTVRPCPDASSCGARVELPVSRALLGLFPNTYLLADQLAMGQLGLCYEEVRWVEREMRPARMEDEQVANYHGRLSFELLGTFDDGTGPEIVFRQRLTAGESRHYLFAAASDALLDLECPASLAGQPVASQLPDNRRGLVPDRLTYFVSTPNTAEAVLGANWERGSEWRDWFITGDRVEILETPRPALLQARVQAELEALVSRRERRMAARLLAADDQDILAQNLAVVADLSALLRRVLEIHYPRLLRHDAELRSALVGSRGLLSREQVRRFRDSGRPMAELAAEGRERLLALQEYWERLPEALREQGQRAPELDHALGQVAQLRKITQPPAPLVESLPEP